MRRRTSSRRIHTNSKKTASSRQSFPFPCCLPWRRPPCACSMMGQVRQCLPSSCRTKVPGGRFRRQTRASVPSLPLQLASRPQALQAAGDATDCIYHRSSKPAIPILPPTDVVKPSCRYRLAHGARNGVCHLGCNASVTMSPGEHASLMQESWISAT